MSLPYIPARGDAVWIDFQPQRGHEQAGRRPAIVLSPIEYNKKTGLAVFCPVTNQRKGYPFEVNLPEGLPITGTALTDQIKSLDWQARNAEHACTLPKATVEAILAKARLLLA